MFSRPLRPASLLALVLAWTGISRADEEVRVSIHEGESRPEAWQLLKSRPTDTFNAPALGFVQVPAKLNGRGIEIDRSSPYLIRAVATLRVPPGSHQLILRARGAARLILDGVVLAETVPIQPNSSGHEGVPEVAPPKDPRWHSVAVGDQERLVPWQSDGKSHGVELLVLIGDRKTRPETGELSVSVVANGRVPILIGGSDRFELSEEGWTAFASAERQRVDSLDAARRSQSARSEDPYWRKRHELARNEAERQSADDRPSTGNFIDRDLSTAGVKPGLPVDDAAFFRRLALDTIGLVPEAAEVEEFLADTRPDKYARAIDARLADPRWADGWMGYWQDVLAENPGILKPTLNNTGPFRRYLHQAISDNKPFDRFVTELIRMEGSAFYGGPAGFSVATQNDAPMAAKAHVLAKAFLAAEMKCARCHDAPSHPFEQADLFGLAALLANRTQTVPGTSTVKRQPGGRTPIVSVSLKEGDRVEPAWNLDEIGPGDLPEGFLPAGASPRDRLAALITSPRNTRFAPVIVNRLWTRYLGAGLVEPVDDWDHQPTIRHSGLLAALARELMSHNYDIKHVARLILNSRVYRAQTDSGKDFMGPARRRLSAEQLVDSLFASVGKPFRAEELTLDPDGRRPPTEFLNLGVPRRAWQFASTSNERDRPALSLPIVQSVVDVLESFGWRGSRQDPLTVRDEATTPLQPAVLANGVVANRIIRLSDDSAITELCLKDQSTMDLIRTTYLRVLSRPPTMAESGRLVAYLGDSYSGRVVPGVNPEPIRTRPRRVTWSNHLSSEASRIQLEMEKEARAGDPPTGRLSPEFRERMEDILWALINSPEFVFIP